MSKGAPRRSKLRSTGAISSSLRLSAAQYVCGSTDRATWCLLSVYRCMAICRSPATCASRISSCILAPERTTVHIRTTIILYGTVQGGHLLEAHHRQVACGSRDHRDSLEEVNRLIELRVFFVLRPADHLASRRSLSARQALLPSTDEYGTCRRGSVPL